MNEIDKKLARRKVDIVTAYKQVFQTEAGREVLHDLMDKGYFIKPTYSPDSPSAEGRNEGRRELLLYILSNVQMSEDELLTMIEMQTKKAKEVFNEFQAEYISESGYIPRSDS